ncbi:P-II family nitrogen regulator [Desulforudis sp. 1088]|uniref:P-II family nitrogen regulator n=1 Tax=unclassified Candidatus Desulforudis TaxID=2635950 RepID=UPI00347285A0
MKEIMAIIRPNKMHATKEALVARGFPALTAQKVLGRGKQRGVAEELTFRIDPNLVDLNGHMTYVPKRMLTIVVDDDQVQEVIETIMATNRTGAIGDGRIFVLPIEEAVRMRTGETGPTAIK